MIQFFRENNGDYLAIDTSSNAYYLALGKDEYEGRATAIEGQVGSVCTTGIARALLRHCCKRVPRKAVPAEWRKAIGM